jgi:phenylpropionate dioxygenase-like ring-hydroxylating dioxygenase large terminal subunit
MTDTARMGHDLSDAEIGALVQPTRVHRRVYSDPAIFELELERIFARAWCYVGHESQVAEAGCFLRASIARRPLIVVRKESGDITVLHNRCGHRGALVVEENTGRVKGGFRCPYHAWAFHTDGRLQSVPCKKGYEGTNFNLTDPTLGMLPVARVGQYRGFIFASLATDGPELEEFLGPTRNAIDNMLARAPAGRLEVTGGAFRARQHNNWKIYLENMHDGLHPMIVHQPSIDPARAGVQSEPPPTGGSAFALTVIAANGQTYESMGNVPVRNFPLGHTEMGAFRENPAIEPEFREYREQLVAIHGTERTDQLLSDNRLSTMIYPSASVQATSLQMRVITPQAVDRTLIEYWSLRLVGAPDSLFHRTVVLANTAHSPSSIIKHDDFGIYARVQAGLVGNGPEWIDYRRGLNDPSTALSEAFIRNQFQAWRAYMTAPSP